MSVPLVDRVRLRLASDGPRAPVAEVARQESALIVDSGALDELSGELSAELSGAGPLEPMLALAGVTDVLVNAADQVWLDRGFGLERSGVRFVDDDAVRRLAVRLAGRAGRRLDDAMPFVDAALPDGTRLHAVLPPLVAHPTISLRVLARRRLSFDDLVSAGTVSAPLSGLLRSLVDARLTVVISGGTGAGKTTLLAALLGCVSASERVLTIEDAPELSVDHPHVVQLVTRAANLEQAGSVGLRDLVRQALRMRPDRLVVGEFRGAEVVDLLTALNTGHAGGMATIHANSAADVPARLIALAALGGVGPEVLTALAASAIDAVVHVGRGPDGVRVIEQVALWPSAAGGAPDVVWCRRAGVGSSGVAVLTRRLLAAGVAVPTLDESRP